MTPNYEVSPLEAIRARAGATSMSRSTRVWSRKRSVVVGAVPPVPSSSSRLRRADRRRPARGVLPRRRLVRTPAATITDPIAARRLASTRLFGVPIPSLPGSPPANSIRSTGTLTPPQTSDYRFALTAFGTGRVYLDDELVMDVPATPDTGTRYLDARLIEGRRMTSASSTSATLRRRRS